MREMVDKFGYFAEQLWRGRGVDVDEIVRMTNQFVQKIEDAIPNLKEVGIDIPMGYITEAMTNLSKAIEGRDDYCLADCLYYEWREIAVVIQEVLVEIE